MTTLTTRYGRELCAHTVPALQESCPRCHGAGFYLPELRVLTLSQPYASLMAWGEKRNETRSQRWQYRGFVAIHASAGKHRHVADTERLAEAMRRHGDPEFLPEGMIVAVVRFFNCYATAGQHALIDEKERAFGDYAAGRYFYPTTDLQPLVRPVPCKGAQGLRIAPEALRSEIAKELARK